MQLTAPEAASAGHPRLGPLSAGAVVDERLTIVSVLEEGPIRRYEATHEGRSVLLLEALRSDTTSQLQNQRQILEKVKLSGLYSPTELFEKEGFDYAFGPYPGLLRLSERVERSGSLTAAEVDGLSQKILKLLTDLHSQGLLLRAVQPNRVWLTDNDEPVLDNWERAIAFPVGSAATGAEEEFCSVTAGFSAPEMYGLGKQDQRVDIFSVGAIIYYCLTGQPPQLEARESFFSVIPPQVKDGEALVSVMMKALSKSPDERFADAEAMRAALAQRVLIPSPAPAPVPQRGGPNAATVSSNGADARTEARPRGAQGPWVAMKSHVGMVRKINQDACLDLRFQFYEKSQPSIGHMVAVVDGMGGEAEGDKAASIAMRTLAQEMVDVHLALRNGRQTTPLLPNESAEMCRHLLQRALVSANANILSYASMSEARRGMGCTVTVCLLYEQRAYFGHVGDTRGFHFRKGLDQVTTDHSLVGRLVAMGSMTAEEARNSPQRSIIYRALGTNNDIEVDVYERDLSPGDRIVICCDGVWEYYEASELEGFVRQADSPQSLCDRLVETCLSRGADDNATVAAIWV